MHRACKSKGFYEVGRHIQGLGYFARIETDPCNMCTGISVTVFCDSCQPLDDLGTHVLYHDQSVCQFLGAYADRVFQHGFVIFFHLDKARVFNRFFQGVQEIVGIIGFCDEIEGAPFDGVNRHV